MEWDLVVHVENLHVSSLCQSRVDGNTHLVEGAERVQPGNVHEIEGRVWLLGSARVL